MKFSFVATGNKMATMERKSSAGRENPVHGSVPGEKSNICVIFPVNVTMAAEAIERKDNNWFVRTKAASDLIVRIRDSSFHLHKLPMVARSGYLNRLVFQKSRSRGKGNILTIQIDNLPGGAEIFELVVKFCYGWKVELTAANIAPLCCAALFLELSDGLEPANLISKAEAFLSFVLFSSWKDIFQILKSCESVSSQSKELQIVKRCADAIAWKACIDPKAFGCSGEDVPYSDFLANDPDIADDWWFEDVSLLRIDHFLEVIESVKKKGMRPELIGSCIAHWTAKWFLRSTIGLENLAPKTLIQQLQKVTIESLIRILPVEQNSVSCNFLLRLLKVGSVMKINRELLNKVENRIASILVQCCVADLLVENHGENDTVYDVKIVISVVKSYVSFVSREAALRLIVVGRLIDGYLTVIARDENLSPKNFQELAEALPKNARNCHDHLYRAMDMYLKAHPRLSEEERTGVCRDMDHHKLSKEALHHALKNDRLPVQLTARLILLKQVNIVKSMAVVGSNYKRTKDQTIIRVNKRSDKGWMTSEKEIMTMRSEVETIKGQLDKLQKCKLEIQKQVKRCIL